MKHRDQPDPAVTDTPLIMEDLLEQIEDLLAQGNPDPAQLAELQATAQELEHGQA